MTKTKTKTNKVNQKNTQKLAKLLKRFSQPTAVLEYLKGSGVSITSAEMRKAGIANPSAVIDRLRYRGNFVGTSNIGQGTDRSFYQN